MSIKIFSISSFHISKIFPLNLLLSIFEVLSIYFHHKNQYCKAPNVTRFITYLSQTLSHKGVPLKPITAMITNVDFNLVQLTTANGFLIKIENIQWHTHTHTLHIDFTLETQTEKTNNIFRDAPLILYSSSVHF